MEEKRIKVLFMLTCITLLTITGMYAYGFFSAKTSGSASVTATAASYSEITFAGRNYISSTDVYPGFSDMVGGSLKIGDGTEDVYVEIDIYAEGLDTEDFSGDVSYSLYYTGKKEVKAFTSNASNATNGNICYNNLEKKELNNNIMSYQMIPVCPTFTGTVLGTGLTTSSKLIVKVPQIYTNETYYFYLKLDYINHTNVDQTDAQAGKDAFTVSMSSVISNKLKYETASSGVTDMRLEITKIE